MAQQLELAAALILLQECGGGEGVGGVPPAELREDGW